MSFYKYFSENDRVVSSRPLPEIVTMDIKNARDEEDDSPQGLHYNSDISNFTKFVSGSSFELGVPQFDVTFGTSLREDGISEEQILQYNIYNQFAKILLGHDVDNNIKKFEILEGVSPKPEGLRSDLPYCFMINIDRRHAKDRISYQTLELDINIDTDKIIKIKTDSIVNTGADGHHYGILKIDETNTTSGLLHENAKTESVGFVFYEAGIILLSPYIFCKYDAAVDVVDNFSENVCGVLTTSQGCTTDLTSLIQNEDATIDDYAQFIKEKINLIKFTSITELNSTIYFCRAYNHEFNYSSNPTYINNGEIIVKNGDPEEPSRTYITTVGLYSDDNQLLAVAKLSEPILKTKDNELIARVRLDW